MLNFIVVALAFPIWRLGNMGTVRCRSGVRTIYFHYSHPQLAFGCPLQSAPLARPPTGRLKAGGAGLLSHTAQAYPSSGAPILHSAFFLP